MDPSNPPPPSKSTIIADRGFLVFKRAFSHADYTEIMKEVIAGRSSNDPRRFMYEDEVFKEADRLLRLDDYIDPIAFPGASVLKPNRLQEMIEEIWGSEGPWRAGIDNTHLPVRVWSPSARRLASKDLENMSLTKIGSEERILHPAMAACGETGLNMRLLCQVSGLFPVLARLGQPSLVTGDHHGIEILRGGGGPVCMWCNQTYESLQNLSTEQLTFDKPVSSLPWDFPCRDEIVQIWKGNEEAASLSVMPGWWHSVGTAITHLFMIAGVWEEVSSALEDIHGDCVMNGGISIKGVECIISGELARVLPAVAAILAPAALQLAAAESADDALTWIVKLHEQFHRYRNGTRGWTKGVHAILHIVQASLKHWGGSLTAFREKSVERAHQIPKIQARHAQGDLFRLHARSNSTLLWGKGK